MFGVSVLMSDFKSLTSDEIFPQILVAIIDLAGRDLRRLDQHYVGRAHVAIHRSLSVVVEAGHVAARNLDHPDYSS
jgi:hypothetical protein